MKLQIGVKLTNDCSEFTESTDENDVKFKVEIVFNIDEDSSLKDVGQTLQLAEMTNL